MLAEAIFYSEQHTGQIEDAGNRYDTPETVNSVKAHNRVYEVTCPRGTLSAE